MSSSGGVELVSAAASCGGGLRKREKSKCAAIRTGASTRSAKPSATASSAESQVSACMSASISVPSWPDLSRQAATVPAFIRSSASAIARMSAAVPATSPEGSCSTSMAFSGMTTSSPAMAIMLAIEAAMPSIQTVIAASWRFSAL